MNKALTIIERIVIPHTAFADAQRQIEQCFTFSAGQGAQGLAIVGESGTGKTSLLESFESKHEPIRRDDGMAVPVLRATVPSGPTVKSLAGKLLEALNAPDPERGTENEKSRRLRILMKKSGTRMVMIDEFQHFYDRGKRQIMYNVADWLKVLIDDTGTTLVVAGLCSCRNVIDGNEQLARRFLAPIQLPRFSWTDVGQRGQFICILKAFHNEIAKQFEVPAFHSEQMAFRFYCSTGGLIGYLANLLKQTLRNAAVDGRNVIRLDDLATAHVESVWSSEYISALPNPFERSFRLVESVDLLNRVWVFSTWFHDVLSIAPGLVITGPAHEGDAVLRALYAFCYHPVLVAGMTGAALSAIQWDKKPTLLIFEPNLSRRSAALLCSSTRRGYLALRTMPGASRSAFDYYGPKAVFAGEDPPIKALLQHCVHINALPASGVYSEHVAPMTQDMTQHLQNQILRYRSEHLPEVSKLELCAAGLSPDFNAIASALCECIVNAPDLQNELVSLLTPYSDQQIAERLDDLGTLSVGAALALCHQGKDQILINEIATEVNRVLKDRGERIQYSPEKVGHRLKKAGLLSQRVSAAGNGFVLDHATRVRIHEVAVTYGCVGSTDDKENLHCSLCQQNK